MYWISNLLIQYSIAYLINLSCFIDNKTLKYKFRKTRIFYSCCLYSFAKSFSKPEGGPITPIFSFALYCCHSYRHNHQYSYCIPSCRSSLLHQLNLREFNPDFQSYFEKYIVLKKKSPLVPVVIEEIIAWIACRESSSHIWNRIQLNASPFHKCSWITLQTHLPHLIF